MLKKTFIFISFVALITSCSTNQNLNNSSSSTSQINSFSSTSIISSVDSSTIDIDLKEKIELSKDFADVEYCKIRDDVKHPFFNVTFPRGSSNLKNKGTITIGVVYVDFADFRWNETKTTFELTEFIFDGIEKYYNVMSNGDVNFKWIVSDKIVNMKNKVVEYDIQRSQINPVVFDFKREFATYIDSAIDISKIDALFVGINPSIPEIYADVSAMWSGTEEFWYHRKEVNGKMYYLNQVSLLSIDTRRIGALTMIHEMGHMYGLLDSYSSNYQRNPNDPNDWLNQFTMMGRFGLMNYATGGAEELLSWERFVIGWIKNEEIKCIKDNGEYFVDIAPSYTNIEAPKMISINLSETKNLILESKTKNEYCSVCYDGVLVYTVDSTKGTMQGAIQMVVPEHSKDRLYLDGLLTEESGKNILKYEGITIEIIEKTDQKFIIKILKNQ